METMYRRARRLRRALRRVSGGSVSIIVVLLLALMGGSGCDDTDHDGGTATPCGSHADCPPESHCGRSELCLVTGGGCSSDADCAWGAHCQDGQCVSALTVQTSAAPTRVPIDVLIVIDDAPSACDMQQRLVAELEALAAGGGLLGLDMQFAVITPDTVDIDRGGGVFRTAPGTYDPPCRFPIDLTRCQSRTSGVIHARNYALDNDLGRRTLAYDLACLAWVGNDGSGPRMGLEAMRQALTDPAQAAEFLRPNARLAIVFASNTNDCSDGTIGTEHGPVYAQTLEDGHAYACEYQRNVEDSCPWVVTRIGEFVTHDGREQSAFQWCIAGDRSTVVELADVLQPQCPNGECANALTPRREYYDFLVDLVADKNGHGDDREAAAADIGIVSLINLDGGTRYDPPDVPATYCDGRNGYRYNLFARMFPRHGVEALCSRESGSPIVDPAGPVLGQPVTEICLEHPPLQCDPSLGENACVTGTCVQYFEGRPEEYFTCSDDVVVRVTVDAGAGPIPVPPRTGFRVEFASPRCLEETGSPVAVQLQNDYDPDAIVTIEYLKAD